MNTEPLNKTRIMEELQAVSELTGLPVASLCEQRRIELRISPDFFTQQKVLGSLEYIESRYYCLLIEKTIEWSVSKPIKREDVYRVHIVPVVEDTCLTASWFVKLKI